MSFFSGRATYDFASAIDVEVGDEKEIFRVNKATLATRSKPFRDACSSRWKSVEIVSVPQADPKVFNLYLRYVHTRVARANNELDFKPLIERYAMACLLEDLDAANAFIDELVKVGKITDSIPNGSNVELMLRCTPSDSPMRRLFVDFYVEESPLEVFDEGSDDDPLPPKFLQALSREFVRRAIEADRSSSVRHVTRNGVARKPKCFYHQHNESCPPCHGRSSLEVTAQGYARPTSVSSSQTSDNATLR